MRVVMGDVVRLVGATVLAMGAVVSLCNCAGTIEVRERTVPVGYPEGERSILNSAGISSDAEAALRRAGIGEGDRRDPFSIAEALCRAEGSGGEELAELLIAQGRELEKRGELRRAAGCYLEAVRRCGGGGLAAGGKRRDLANHATGRVVVALHRAGVDLGNPGRIETPAGEVVLRTRKSGRGVFDPSYFDEVSAADSLSISEGFFRQRVVEPGVGAALLGYRENSPEREESEPFVVPVGRALPATATIEWINDRRAELVLHDVWVSDRASLNGGRLKLATDFTAPLANLMAYAPEEDIGLAGLMRPDDYLGDAGLFMVEPLRKDKVPVVFVHGLLSRPATWKNTVNDLLANREIRERYQFWVYRYPTGVPVIFSAAGLRERLGHVRERYGSEGELGRMVIIGHSMGGLLSNLQIRRAEEEDWAAYLSGPLSGLRLGAEKKKRVAASIEFEANPAIDRAIFVASPHRGSPLARGWMGKIGGGLVRAPGELLTLQTPEVLESATELGRSVLSAGTTSIKSLSDRNTVLEIVLGLPVGEQVKFHSIIGDRGRKGALRESSDGFVPYWSSHLDGAESEKMVPSGHDVHDHPEAIAEIERILLLHLEESW